MTRPEDYRHPAFPQPDAVGTVIWRYLDEQKFAWLVTEKRLFMASTNQLGDPLEGTTPFGHVAWWQQELAKAAHDDERAIIILNHRFLESFSSRLRSGYFVSCWHENCTENPRMWDQYTASGDAVAIHTTYSELRSSLPSYLEMGRVRYIDYGTADLPSMNILERITHKDLKYDFEQEIRAVAHRQFVHGLEQAEFDQHHFERIDLPGALVFAPPIDPVRLIHGVVLHPDASPSFAARLARLCSENGLPVPQTSCVRVPAAREVAV